MNRTLILRSALAANAAFSFSCGILMLARPASVGDWLGIDTPFVLQAVGLGLLIFAADLIHQTTRPRMATWRALGASAADFLWVLATAVLLAIFPDTLSSTGVTLVLGVAFAVLAFGICQVFGIARAHSIAGSPGYRHCILVETEAPADAMWRIVANVADIRLYMPALKNSTLVGEPAVPGAVRHCEDHRGNRWSEEIVSYEPGRTFTVRFRTEAEGFPFPTSQMRGGWEVMPTSGGSRVMVWWEMSPKPAALAPVILPLLAFQADRDFPKVIHRMALHAITGRPPGSGTGRSLPVLARVLPHPC